MAIDNDIDIDIDGVNVMKLVEKIVYFYVRLKFSKVVVVVHHGNNYYDNDYDDYDDTYDENGYGYEDENIQICYQ